MSSKLNEKKAYIFTFYSHYMCSKCTSNSSIFILLVVCTHFTLMLLTKITQGEERMNSMF